MSETLTEILYLPQSKFDAIAHTCAHPSKNSHEPSVFESYVIPFDDGFEAEVKVCNGDYPYCEVVLFKDGQEVDCSDAYDNLNFPIELKGHRIKFVPTMDGIRGYYWLSNEEKVEAREYNLRRLLGYISEGFEDFDDPALIEKINVARKRADDMRTPWFTHEYVLETCRPELEGIAFKMAVRTLYVDDTISVVHSRLMRQMK